MHVLAALLALLTSACAYQVTRPSASQGWSDLGPQTVAWNRVSTDPANFTIVLTNQNRGNLPQDQILVAEQDGGDSSGQTLVNPPSGGWRIGSGFRVNLVQDVNNMNAILAQSSEFTINSTIASSSIITVPRPTGTLVQPNPVATNTSPSSTADSPNPANNSAAPIAASTGLMALLGTVTYLLM